MSDEWQVEPSEPGMLGRLLAPQSSTKPAVTAFLAGVGGTGAFVASLVLGWQKITVAEPPSSSSGRTTGSGASDVTVLNAGIGSIDVLGLVYILGALGLLTILGSVLVRPESALRMRMAAVGLGIGVLGVLVAIAVRLPETIFNLQGIFGGLSTELQRDMMDRSDVAYEPGMFAAFAAVGLLSAAIWLAGAPAARSAARWAAFAAAYPGYAQQYAAYYQGGYQYPPPVAPNGSVVPTQAANGATPAGQPETTGVAVGSVPSATANFPTPPAQSYPPSPSPYAPPPASVYAPPQPSTWSRAGLVDELTVMPSEPLDPGTSPDVWRG